MPTDSNTPAVWASMKDEIAILEGRVQVANVRRQLIASGQGAPRSYSRNSASESDLRKEALTEIDEYLADISKLLEQKRLQLQALSAEQQTQKVS